jgi:hypothetical protein
MVVWSAKHDSKSYVRNLEEFVERLREHPMEVSEEVKVLIRNGGAFLLRAQLERAEWYP